MKPQKKQANKESAPKSRGIREKAPQPVPSAGKVLLSLAAVMDDVAASLRRLAAAEVGR